MSRRAFPDYALVGIDDRPFMPEEFAVRWAGWTTSSGTKQQHSNRGYLRREAAHPEYLHNQLDGAV